MKYIIRIINKLLNYNLNIYNYNLFKLLIYCIEKQKIIYKLLFLIIYKNI